MNEIDIHIIITELDVEVIQGDAVDPTCLTNLIDHIKLRRASLPYPLESPLFLCPRQSLIRQGEIIEIRLGHLIFLPPSPGKERRATHQSCFELRRPAKRRFGEKALPQTHLANILGPLKSLAAPHLGREAL